MSEIRVKENETLIALCGDSSALAHAPAFCPRSANVSIMRNRVSAARKNPKQPEKGNVKH